MIGLAVIALLAALLLVGAAEYVYRRARLHVYVCACGKVIPFNPRKAPSNLRELRCQACRR